MTKTPTRPRDVNQLAKLVVEIAAGQTDDGKFTPAQERAAKGGKEGGKSRAAALTPAERSKIASIAASARWKKS